MARAESRRDSLALPLGSLFGIPVRVHLTFVLFLGYIGWSAARRGEQPLVEVAFLVLLFACVLLHELGHALAARRFGVRTREIVLYPIGGVARLEGMPGGKAELLIALAGPAVNVVIAGLLFGARALARGPWPSAEEIFIGGALVPRLLATNIMLVVFNMIPAFPMDGGRVLRASLTFFTSRGRATQIAARVGQVIAVVFGLLGIWNVNTILVLIAFFVFMGAGQEASYERSRAVMTGRTARDAMIGRFDILRPQDTLARASRLHLDTQQQDFPVIDAWGRLAGILERQALLDGLAQQGPDTPVLELMRREAHAVHPDAPLEEVVQRLQTPPGPPVLVVEGTTLLGMVTLENLAELIEIAQRTRASAALPPNSQRR